MKVYYDYPQQFHILISAYEAISPTLGQMVKDSVFNLHEKNKYKLMWSLRTIEHTIEEEGGIIILNKWGKMECLNFTSETAEKIHALYLANFEKEEKL